MNIGGHNLPYPIGGNSTPGIKRTSSTPKNPSLEKLQDVNSKTTSLKQYLANLEKSSTPDIKNRTVTKETQPHKDLSQFLNKDEDIEMNDDSFGNELESLFADKIVEMDPSSPFADTDLVIFKDDYTGNLPLNGIKESQFKEITVLYNRISSKNDPQFQIDSGNDIFHGTIVEALKVLLTRDIGRRLIKKVVDKEPLIIKNETITGLRHKERYIGIDLAENNLIIELLPTGKKKLQDTPLYITLAHEMAHQTHIYRSINAMSPPNFEEDYDNMEEQLTITGLKSDVQFSKEISEDEFIEFSNSKVSELINKDIHIDHNPLSTDAFHYDEFNERNFSTAFASRDKAETVMFPRFGHRGIMPRPDINDKEKVIKYIALLIENDLTGDLSNYLEEFNVDLKNILKDKNSELIFDNIILNKSDLIRFFIENDFRDSKGYDITYYLFKKGSSEEIIEFLENKAPLSQEYINQLHSENVERIFQTIAFYGNKTTIVNNFLIDDLHDHEGNRVQHYLTASANNNEFKEFINNRVDFSVKNSSGETPIEYGLRKLENYRLDEQYLILNKIIILKKFLDIPITLEQEKKSILLLKMLNEISINPHFRDSLLKQEVNFEEIIFVWVKDFEKLKNIKIGDLTAVLYFLTKKGVNWGKKDAQGNTFLHLILSNSILEPEKKIKIFSILLEMNASLVNQKNNEGLSPLEILKTKVKESNDESYTELLSISEKFDKVSFYSNEKNIADLKSLIDEHITKDNVKAGIDIILNFNNTDKKNRTLEYMSLAYLERNNYDKALEVLDLIRNDEKLINSLKEKINSKRLENGELSLEEATKMKQKASYLQAVKDGDALMIDFYKTLYPHVLES